LIQSSNFDSRNNFKIATTTAIDIVEPQKSTRHAAPYVAEACATLRLPFRRKNLSESEKSSEQEDKENQNPSCGSSASGINHNLKSSNKNSDQSRFLDHHRLMLQEHVRRIRGRQLEEEQELHEQHHDQHPEQQQQPKTSSSPQRANSNILLRLESPGQSMVPYCPITVKSTREIAGFNGLAEALLRLDFIRAVSDIRRFHYVSHLMFLLFAHDKLSQLPGAAQKVLFRMLEEMANTVYKSNANEHVFRKLMDELQTTMTIYRVWGSHLGSSQLFKQHLESRRRITEFVEKMQVEYKQDLATPSTPGLVSALPEECIREILLRLSDPSDLDRASKTCETMKAVASEKRVWRELVQTHFSKLQIEYVLQEKPQLKETKDWKELYASLRRKYGLREEFTEMIMLCRKCCALFWKSLGHPCFVLAEEAVFTEHNEHYAGATTETTEANANLPAEVENKKEGGQNGQHHGEQLIPVSPKSFLTFFSV